LTCRKAKREFKYGSMKEVVSPCIRYIYKGLGAYKAHRLMEKSGLVLILQRKTHLQVKVKAAGF
jgi:hypothetical protein